MKKLTKIRLINWHYFSNETIDVSNNILLTGQNATGKSTILISIFSSSLQQLFHISNGLFILSQQRKVFPTFYVLFCPIVFLIRIICPKCHLTSISTLKIISVNIFCILLATINMIFYIFHKLRKIPHNKLPPQILIYKLALKLN